MIRIYKVKNAEYQCGYPLRPQLCYRLALTAMTANSKDQTSPKEFIPPILMIIVCYSSLSLLVIRIYEVKKEINLTSTSIKLLAIQPVSPHSHADKFLVLNEF